MSNDIETYKKMLAAIKERKAARQAEAAETAEAAQVATETQSANAAIDVSALSKEEVNKRSIFVGNLDYTVTKAQLESYFQSCGKINRITICEDHMTHRPKGFGYIEFAEESSVQNAMLLNEHLLAGKTIQIQPKRENIPKKILRRQRGRRGGRR